MSEERQQPNSRPSSSSLFWGLWRQGLKDAQNAVLNPWNGVTATHEEPGTIASPTQAVVTQEIGTVRGYQSTLDDYAARASQGREQNLGMER